MCLIPQPQKGSEKYNHTLSLSIPGKSGATGKDLEPQLPSKPWTRKMSPVPPPVPEEASKPWTKKPIGKTPEADASPKPWMKKPSGKPSDNKDGPPTSVNAKPSWAKKPLGKPFEEKDEPPPLKPWMKKPPVKPSEEEDEPSIAPTSAKPWTKKPLPPSSKEEKPSQSKPLFKNKPPLKGAGDSANKPPWIKDTSPEPIEEEPPPPPPPFSAKNWKKDPQKPSKESGLPGAGRKPPPTVQTSAGVVPREEEVPDSPRTMKRVFTYK